VKLVEVRGLAGLLANFKGLQGDIATGLRRVSDRAGRDTVKLARQFVPKDTHRTKNAITYTLSEAGYTVHIFVDPEPFAADGEPYYPPYVERGTSVSPAQPFMFPAWEAIRPHYQKDVQNVILEACRKRSI
jgi:HK97 gp10 family phage protein